MYIANNTKKIISEKMNALGSEREPFIFIIDYSCQNYFISPLKTCPDDILISIPGQPLYTPAASVNPLKIKNSITFEAYKHAFDTVKKYMVDGNTYILNLTFPTEVELDSTLYEIFCAGDALFKLFYKNEFVCFSPERFVRLQNESIKTYPMKGTIDASVENACSVILHDEKEKAEHLMIVDLLRNDLSMVSRNVKVNRYSYIDKISAGGKELYQVSSEIEGHIGANWHGRIGDIIMPLLPAGSITGAPKIKTMEIIDQVENYSRGFYTGIFGVYDGVSCDSAVMIRFIEKHGDSFRYKSGGGITFDSDVFSEYQELLAKVYIPARF